MSSIVVVIDSEEQVAAGAKWWTWIAESAGARIHIAVLGENRKTLSKLARSRIQQTAQLASDRCDVDEVERDVMDVLRFSRTVDCRTLLIPFRPHDVQFQRSLFEQSPFPTVWLRANGPPPQTSADVQAMFDDALVTVLGTEQTMQVSPAGTLCKEVDFNSDDLAAAVLQALAPERADDGQAEQSDDGQAEQSDNGQAERADEGKSQSTNLLVCGVEKPIVGDRKYDAAITLMQQLTEPSIALVHMGDSLIQTMVTRLRHWAAEVAPPMDRDERTALAKDLESGSNPNLEFLGLISASSMLAAFGLLQDSAAVIIGAMLIAPLMTPILGAGLALTQGNRPLFRHAIKAIAIGFAGAVMASMFFGWLYSAFQNDASPDRFVTPEMWARSRPSPLDFCVGLVGGMAASYARTRTYLSSALAGAAIAAALVPPLATAGLQLSFGMFAADPRGLPIFGPILLVMVNVIMIMIGSSFVLWARGMRGIDQRDRWVLRTVAVLVALGIGMLVWMVQH